MIYEDDIDDVYDEDIPKGPILRYTGSKFTLTANPNNELEVAIIAAFNTDPSLQKKLEYEEPNKQYHDEWCVGVHVEQCLRHARKMIKKCPNWKRDEPVLIPAILVHDLCKEDEEFYEYKQIRNPKTHHACLAAQMAEAILGIKDSALLNIIQHHDDYHRLYQQRDILDAKVFSTFFHNFYRNDIEALIRFGYIDIYRPRSKSKEKLKKYRELYALFKEQMNWFITMAKKSNLILPEFESFS